MKRRVLFLCTGNSCRSQMAEGLLRHLAGERFEVESAEEQNTTLHALALTRSRQRPLGVRPFPVLAVDGNPMSEEDTIHREPRRVRHPNTGSSGAERDMEDLVGPLFAIH